MRLLVCGLAAGLSLAGAQAAEDSGHYFKFDVGANYLGKIHQEFTTPVSERDLHFNLGVRGSVAEGFAFNRFLALEVETGAAWNELDGGVDWFMQVPILANAVLRYECKGGWTAYVAAGGGGVVAIARTSFIEHDADVDLVPAWQGTAGINYRVGNVSVGIVYKYLGMTNPNFELSVGGVTQEFKFHNIQNHYGGVQLTYNF